MRGTSFMATGSANFGTDRSVGSNTPIGRTISGAIAATARKLWKNKTAIELAARTGMSPRTAERILAGHRDMGLGYYGALLASAEGVEFFGAVIDALPERARKRWYAEFDRTLRAIARQRRIEELEAEEERDADEADQLRMSLARRG